MADFHGVSVYLGVKKKHGGYQMLTAIPSGKHTKNYGKSPCLMGKLTISMAISNCKLLVYQRVVRIYHGSTLSLGPAGLCSSCALCGLGADTGARKSSEAFGAMGDGLHPMIFL